MKFYPAWCVQISAKKNSFWQKKWKPAFFDVFILPDIKKSLVGCVSSTYSSVKEFVCLASLKRSYYVWYSFSFVFKCISAEKYAQLTKCCDINYEMSSGLVVRLIKWLIDDMAGWIDLQMKWLLRYKDSWWNEKLMKWTADEMTTSL